MNDANSPPVPPVSGLTRPVYEGEWGYLEDEPCRFCHQTHCVYFLIDDQPAGTTAGQICRCEKCKRDWEAGSSKA